MKIALRQKYRIQRQARPLLTLFVRNPILVLGLDLPFVIVCATTLRTAAALSLEMLLIHMVTIAVSLLTVRFLPMWLRPVVNIGVSFIVMTLARYWVTLLFPDLSNYVGMYIYLMAVNGITVYQCLQVTRKAHPVRVLLNAFLNVLAFAMTMLVVALVREYLSGGMVWGIAVPMAIPMRLSGLALPPGGFLLMGFVLAFTKFLDRAMLAVSIGEARRLDARYTEISPAHEPSTFNDVPPPPGFVDETKS